MEIKSEAEYTSAISDQSLAVVHFMADWATECATITAVLTELAKDPALKNVKFHQLAAESLPSVSMKHEIVAVPTVLLFRRGKAVDRSETTALMEIKFSLIKHFVESMESMQQRSQKRSRLMLLTPVQIFPQELLLPRRIWTPSSRG